MAGPRKCDVTGCEQPPVRSLSGSRVAPYLEIGIEGGKGHSRKSRAHLCQEHYREYKKKARKDREVERAYWH
ncbi:MAG: hypothetical protein L0Z54_04220 [Thermoplasmata archaeon]|nr:hypothetical protein [Thermoplasmata archaeon]